MGPLLDEKFASRFEEYLGWIQPHHTVYGATGRITAENPRPGFAGDPDAGLFYHPVIVDGVRPGDAIFEEETFGPMVAVTSYRSLDEAIALANAPGYGLSSSIYTNDPAEVYAFRRGISAGNGQREQFDLRRGGTSALRWQWQVRQRIPAVRHVGARPVHPLAGDELGLLGPAAEGADGRCRVGAGHAVPAAGVSNALDEALRSAVAGLRPAKRSGTAATAGIRPGSALSVGATLKLFDAQATSRHLDFAARALQAEGTGFYTIGSAGHESNAAVAAALRPTDPALLHYRSGGFYQARASQVAGSTPVRDVLQGLLCAADEPIAGGRHKVFGNAALSVIPQTSTIASHLPRAVGLAVALHRATKLGVSTPWPEDAVVGLLVRRRVGQSLHCDRRDQHRTQHRLPAAAGADSVRLRGQRPGNLGPHAGRLGRVGVRLSTRAYVLLGRRVRCRCDLRCRARRRRDRALVATASLPTSADGALPRPCGQ